MQFLTRKARFTLPLLLLLLNSHGLAQEAKGALAQYEEIAHENPWVSRKPQNVMLSWACR